MMTAPLTSSAKERIISKFKFVAHSRIELVTWCSYYLYLRGSTTNLSKKRSSKPDSSHSSNRPMRSSSNNNMLSVKSLRRKAPSSSTSSSSKEKAEKTEKVDTHRSDRDNHNVEDVVTKISQALGCEVRPIRWSVWVKINPWFDCSVTWWKWSNARYFRRSQTLNGMPLQGWKRQNLYSKKLSSCPILFQIFSKYLTRHFSWPAANFALRLGNPPAVERRPVGRSTGHRQNIIGQSRSHWV